jgi:pimeloyl-ACP methyl ester carboxylesterase
MRHLVQIPALGCDEQLYCQTREFLIGQVEQRVIVPVANRMSGCVEQVLAEAPETFVILGTSFGGRVALEAILAAPSRVKGLVIIGSGPGAVADQAAGLKRSARLRSGDFEAVLQEMGDIISHLPGPNGVAAMNAFREMAWRMGPEKMATQSDALAYREDLWPMLGEIKCPVLCLWGTHDQYVEGEVGRKMAAAVKRGTYVELPECGHFPTLECPAETARAIESWLRGVSLI